MTLVHDTAVRAAPSRSSAAAPLLDATGLSVTFDGESGQVPAVRGVDLALAPGEILGIVGESGSGKSVTCQALLGLLPASARVEGRILIDGCRVAAGDARAFAGLRGRTLSMIFQDPMSALDPLMTVRRHLLQRLRRHRIPGDLERRAGELLGDAGVTDVDRILQAYPHQLSGGQCQRVALALAGEPRLLVADEPTTALDVTIQAQVLDLLGTLRRQAGLSVVLISHDLGVVAEICDRVAVMYAGQIVETGPVSEVLRTPLHHYTAGLLAARPSLDRPRGDIVGIPGNAPPPGRVPEGCAFAPRCARAMLTCRVAPELRQLSPDRATRCHMARADDD